MMSPSPVMRVLSWAVLVLCAFVCLLQLAWIALAACLLGQAPSASGELVFWALVVLAAAVGAAARWTLLQGATMRQLLRAGLCLAVFVAFETLAWVWAVPDEALYLAREIAWDGSSTADPGRYPQRAIANAPAAAALPRAAASAVVGWLPYHQRGEAKHASLDQLVQTTGTTSFIIIRDGAIVYERYGRGWGRDSVVVSFSIAKSVVSALVGIALEERVLGSPDDRVIAYLPELRGRGLDSLSLRHLLAMSAGIRYAHEDEQPFPIGILPFNDDAHATNSPDLRRFALSARSGRDAPGTAFDYNDLAPVLLAMVLERATRRTLAEYLEEKIWKPLGMEYPASWSLDRPFGIERAFTGLNARAIDFARFGLLYLQRGRWDGGQIVPASWVDASTLPMADPRVWRRATAWQRDGGYYGYLWWGLARRDGSYAYMARGNLQQQWIYVSPRDRLVIARFGVFDGAVDSWPEVFEGIAARLGAPA